MACQTRLAKQAAILVDPLGIDKLLAQFQQIQPGTVPRRGVVAKQMNDIGDSDRLTAWGIEMGRHPPSEA